jgi:hypothetical protein
LVGSNFTQLIVDDIKSLIVDNTIDNTIIWNKAQKIKEKLTYFRKL